MKAISLWQPWASAVALGLKTIETRSRLTWHDGELAICAAQKKSIELVDTLEILRSSNLEIAKGFADLEFLDLPFGAVVAVANLQECVRTDMISNLTPTERALGDYTPGRYGWVLRDVRRLKTPVPVIGRQFLFSLPASVEAKVRAQL
jgi:activating signal cointegrator 1